MNRPWWIRKSGWRWTVVRTIDESWHGGTIRHHSEDGKTICYYWRRKTAQAVADQLNTQPTDGARNDFVSKN